MEQFTLKVQKTARVNVIPAKGETKAVLYALHGYRQLSPYFIQPFETLAEHGVRVVAPEGLHRFYVEGYSGHVGASWMTKEERDTDISDYLAYLNTLHEHLKPEIGKLPVHLLGFSQGGATASRWLSESDINFHSFTLYASVFPNDFDFPRMKDRLNAIPTLLCFGDQDQFADESTIAKKMDWLNSKNVHPELLRFKGKHKVYPEVLNEVWKKISVS